MKNEWNVTVWCGSTGGPFLLLRLKQLQLPHGEFSSCSSSQTDVSLMEDNDGAAGAFEPAASRTWQRIWGEVNGVSFGPGKTHWLTSLQFKNHVFKDSDVKPSFLFCYDATRVKCSGVRLVQESGVTPLLVFTSTGFHLYWFSHLLVSRTRACWCLLHSSRCSASVWCFDVLSHRARIQVVMIFPLIY